MGTGAGGRPSRPYYRYVSRERGVIIDAMGDPNSGQLLYGVLFEIGDEFPTAYFLKSSSNLFPHQIGR